MRRALFPGVGQAVGRSAGLRQACRGGTPSGLERVPGVEIEPVIDWLQWAYAGTFAALGHLGLLLGHVGGVLIQMVGIAAVGKALVRHVRRADKVAGDAP